VKDLSGTVPRVDGKKVGWRPEHRSGTTRKSLQKSAPPKPSEDMVHRRCAAAVAVPMVAINGTRALIKSSDDG